MTYRTVDHQARPGMAAPGVSRRATHALVDLAALRANVATLRATLGSGTQLMAVVKADAYGHGAVPVARAALEAGASWLGVACVDEGVTLRRAGLSAPILVLGPIAPAECEEAVASTLTIALGTLEVVAALAAAAEVLGREAHAHLELDTGMGRHGILPAELPRLLDQVRHRPGLRVDGLFTHFARAESRTAPLTEQQLRLLLEARDTVVASTHDPVIVHAANSAGTLFWPAAHLEMVRAGIALYGYPPEHEADEGEGEGSPVAPTASGHETARLALRPVLTWRTAIARRWTLQPGDGVSYGHIFRAERATPVALLPVGYGDGLPRVLSGRGATVLVHGRRVPIIGRVCMDQTIVDVSACPEAAIGDDVILIGRQGDEWIGADEIGGLAGTNSYETLCRIAPRVPRRYEGAATERGASGGT